MGRTLSLRHRVFLACAFVAALAISVGTLFISNRITTAADGELLRQLAQSAAIVADQHQDRVDTLRLLASLIADLPKLKAAVATNDAPTVTPIATEYMELVRSDVVAITNDDGEPLAALGPFSFEMLQSALTAGPKGGGVTRVHQTPTDAVEIVSFPLTIGQLEPERLGTLSFGFVIDERLVHRLGELAQSDVVVLTRERVLASTLPIDPADISGLFELSHSDVVTLSDSEWVARPVAVFDADGIRTLALRSRSERSAFLSAFREGILLTAAIGALVAVLLSYVVARTVTRPLAAITETMREISSTGDLGRKIDLEGAWQDEDARLLASTFNRLTASISRFQRESALAERLSALGRMSTVMAHEIRNPLMIIKASLRSLSKLSPSARDIEDAVGDINHEVERLNWMVGEVLDFAKPLKVTPQKVDLQELCQNRVGALGRENPSLKLSLELDPRARELITDGELLERAIVNVLSNANDAVQETRKKDGGDGGEIPYDIQIATEARTEDRVAILVRDRGVGIAADELEIVFEPYFTGKRTGTGLGLAITKNIVESLGGTIRAMSAPSTGTEIGIVLPRQPEVPTPPGGALPTHPESASSAGGARGGVE